MKTVNEMDMGIFLGHISKALKAGRKVQYIDDANGIRVDVLGASERGDSAMRADALTEREKAELQAFAYKVAGDKLNQRILQGNGGVAGTAAKARATAMLQAGNQHSK